MANRLRTACLLAALPLAYLSFSSNTAGITGQSVSGCNGSSCHGASSTATVLTLSGLPAKYTAGTAYTVTATVTNSTKAAAGFDLTVTGGTLSGAPGGTSISGNNEIFHTAPKTMTSGAASWTFTWTAPASGTAVKFNFAGNAVNNTGSSAGDAWSTISQDIQSPLSVADLPAAVTRMYPNPAADKVCMELASGTATVQPWVVSATGQRIAVTVEKSGSHKAVVSLSHLASGAYWLVVQDGGGQAGVAIRKL